MDYVLIHPYRQGFINDGLDLRIIRNGKTHISQIYCIEAPQVSTLKVQSVVVMKALVSKLKRNTGCFKEDKERK